MAIQYSTYPTGTTGLEYSVIPARTRAYLYGPVASVVDGVGVILHPFFTGVTMTCRTDAEKEFCKKIAAALNAYDGVTSPALPDSR